MKFKIIDFKTKELIERGSFKEEDFYDLTLYIISHYRTRQMTFDFNNPTIVISLEIKKGCINESTS